MFRSGSNTPTDFKSGSNDVAGIYLGDTQLWVRAAAPTFTAFNLSPEFLLDSIGGNLTISWNVSNATHMKLTEALADGTINTLIDQTVGTGQGQRAPVGNRRRVAPTQNANYTIDINNAMDVHNLRSKQFYRVISPSISVANVATQSYPIRLPLVGVVQRVRITLRITRGGTPLPRLSIASSAGTSVTHDPNRNAGDNTTVDYVVQRNIEPRDSAVSDVITVTGTVDSSLVPANLFTPLTASAQVTLNWPAGG